MSSATPRPKVLFCDHTVALSGGEIALLNLVRVLDRSRYDLCAALFASGPLTERLCNEGVRVQEVLLDPRVAGVRKDSLAGRGLVRAMLSPRSLRFLTRLRRLMVAEDVRIVHTNSLKADILAGLAARMAHRPLIWHIRDRIAEDYLPSAAARFVRKLARILPDRLIANSAATLETLKLREGDPRGIVIHDGMEPLATVEPYPPSGPPLVALVGRIAPWKGQHVFLDAVRHVRKAHPQARFLIVGAALFGEESYECQVRTQCRRLGLEDVVEFTGFVHDIMAVYGRLAVLVHASTCPEPFGQVVMEAMMAGRPVVATNAGGVREIVVDGETGLLVPMNDAACMARAISDLLSDQAKAARMGMAGRERALAEFTIQKTAQRVEAVYDDLLRARYGG